MTEGKILLTVFVKAHTLYVTQPDTRKVKAAAATMLKSTWKCPVLCNSATSFIINSE